MKIFVLDKVVKLIDSDNIDTVTIHVNRRRKNDFEISVSDRDRSYYWYSKMYADRYTKSQCVEMLRSELINKFNIAEDKIRVKVKE